MVQAIININNETNRMLNIIKAKYGLKDKSQAIDMMAREYQDNILEPELQPSYISEAKNIKAQETIKVGSLSDLKKRY